jgi:hypothetical protein
MKLKKYPKKPKASASVATMERYLERCKEVDRHNNQVAAEKKKREALKKRIASIRK